MSSPVAVCCGETQRDAVSEHKNCFAIFSDAILQNAKNGNRAGVVTEETGDRPLCFGLFVFHIHASVKTDIFSFKNDVKQIIKVFLSSCFLKKLKSVFVERNKIPAHSRPPHQR